MTYRERRERRADRREEWAEKRRAKSEAAFNRAHKIADAIPLGQPILAGHHSQKRALRDQARIHSAMDAGIDSQKMASKHAGAADTIRHQLDRSIYSDDHDAATQLRQRIEENEAKRKRVNDINGWLNKNKKRFGLKRLTGLWRWKLTPEVEAQIKSALMAVTEALSLKLSEIENLGEGLNGNGRVGFPSYVGSNLSGKISTDRKRLAELEENDSSDEQESPYDAYM